MFLFTVNVDNQVGAVGFVPSILPKSLHPVALIKINPETCEPIRGSNGFCIRTETSKNCIYHFHNKFISNNCK